VDSKQGFPGCSQTVHVPDQTYLLEIGEEVAMKYGESESAAQPPLLLSLAQAARLLNLCERTVWTLVHASELPHVRIGRRVLISRAALEKWIGQQENASNADSAGIG
jgi:excisionase family DNA binding protein